MRKILVIEDQQLTIEDFRRHTQNSEEELSLLAPRDVGLDSWKLDSDAGMPAEQQLAMALKSLVERKSLDLVVLDSDLSRDANLQTYSSYRAALSAIGMPVCRYQKRGSRSPLARLQHLQRIIKDGNAAIWIPDDIIGGERASELPHWLAAIIQGFDSIRASFEADESLVAPLQSPMDVLSIVVDRPDSVADFLGYAAQNFNFFGNQAELTDQSERPDSQLPKARVYATRLGYWLFNFVIAFPGPILNRHAACAFLNLNPSMGELPAVKQLLDSARYKGPFFEVEDFYWRSDLVELLDDLEGDIASDPRLAGVDLVPIDPEPTNTGYICLLSGAPIRSDESTITPDWIPPGASEARFKEEELDQLGPLAGI